jgi:hypothetical protein
VNKALAGIRDSLEFLKTDFPSDLYNGRFVPKEDSKAAALRYEFFAWLRTQDRRYTARLEAHMKRDLVARALFSPRKTITSDMMERGIAWARHQLEIRQALWPEDAGNPVEQIERKVIEVLRKRLEKVLRENPGLDRRAALQAAGLSDRDLIKACHIERENSGGREAYYRAIKALTYGSREITVVGKNRNNLPIYGLNELSPN